MALLTVGISLAIFASHVCPKITQHCVLLPVDIRINSDKLLLVAARSLLHTQALDIAAELDDGTVMYDAVNGSSCSQRVLKDLVPLRKDKVGGNHEAASFVTFSQESEKHFHLCPTLLDIADVIEDDDLEAVQASQLPFQFVVSLGSQQSSQQA